MTAPERIWHHPLTDIVVHDAKPERHWECNEYLRSDVVTDMIRQAVQAERDACARVCEEWGAWNDTAQHIAAAIRARKGE